MGLFEKWSETCFGCHYYIANHPETQWHKATLIYYFPWSGGSGIQAGVSWVVPLLHVVCAGSHSLSCIRLMLLLHVASFSPWGLIIQGSELLYSTVAGSSGPERRPPGIFKCNPGMGTSLLLVYRSRQIIRSGKSQGESRDYPWWVESLVCAGRQGITGDRDWRALTSEGSMQKDLVQCLEHPARIPSWLPVCSGYSLMCCSRPSVTPTLHLSSLTSQCSQFPLQLYKPLSYYIPLLCLCMGCSQNKTPFLHMLPANSCLYFKTLLRGTSPGMPSRLALSVSLLWPRCHWPSLIRTNSDKCCISPYGKHLSASPTRLIGAGPSHCCISAWHTVRVLHIW